ncbi:hypothetical protein [Streptomyces xiaopingdaonensis]|uniref:hypothetical protein n=1 Tax=Streptomyces xiaopingdaonensis TaxID=1565415 RepID=UPI00037C4AD1|nr:hypothetical protein [Streptomyces xiaopingdaonensis]
MLAITFHFAPTRTLRAQSGPGWKRTQTFVAPPEAMRRLMSLHREDARYVPRGWGMKLSAFVS